VPPTTNEKPIVLASGSPRRKQLLEMLRIPFRVMPPDVDEHVLPGEAPERYVTRLSRVKAEAVAARAPGELILAADTTVVLDSIKPVGYHAWGDAHTLVLFVLGTPPTLQIADARTPGARGEIVAQNIGRSLQGVPGSAAIAFVQRDSVAGNWIKEVTPQTKVVTPLVRAPDGTDFFTWTPGGIALAARGTKLYQWNPQRGQEWEEVADFAAAGLTNVTRLAVSPIGDRLAIVAVPR